MAYTNPWTVNTPVPAQPANQLAAYIQQVRQDLQDRLVQQFWVNMTDDPLVFKPEFLAKVNVGPQEFTIPPFALQNTGQTSNPSNAYPVLSFAGGIAQALIPTGTFYIPLSGFPLGRRITNLRFICNGAVALSVTITLSSISMNLSTGVQTITQLWTGSTGVVGAGTYVINSGNVTIDVAAPVGNPATSVPSLFLTVASALGDSNFRGGSIFNTYIP